LRKLDKYLDKGVFYQKDSSEFGKHFCNDDSEKSTGEIIAEYIKDL